MENNAPSPIPQRIEFIDALKGFLILSVVMCHVAGFCIGIQDDIPSFQPILFEFRNPPFFFVSGLFAYKAGTVWKGSHMASVIKKKFTAIALPTTIFLLVLLYVHPSYNGRTFMHDSLEDVWFHWFTYALFVFFVFYAVIEFVLHLFRCNDTVKDIVLLGIGALCYLLFSVPSVYDKLPFSIDVKQVLGMSYWGFFLFFVLGIMAKKHYTRFERFLHHRWYMAACIVIFLLFNIFSTPLMANHFNLFRIVTYLTGIILVFTFFKTYTLPNRINKFLLVTGKRTLDIYLIHYFFLPLGLYYQASIFRETPMPVIELLLTMSISVIVIALSLLVSYVIRLSPVTAHFILGEKLTKDK